MRSLLIMLSLFMGAAQAASAADTCSAPDANFAAFLDRFKNDQAFQRERILYPLQFTSSEPDAKGGTLETKASLTQKDIQDRAIRIIIGRTEAAPLKGGEGALCEEEPRISGDHATFVQYSCHTDVYGYEFEFVRKQGCWFLQRLATSGG